ncbi:acyl-CoA ligase (AMP-forming), exosortase A system-associated [Microlunatus speluncae]|uniref:acyl-CoA ligase (AMP-forming), exosortase A system-associated n=1 Tax=Microlunatus speluncae TaxID=2594267 RepID=UPI001C2CE5F3|nr:acyl-CoA ligase (AMP-forming), exosortase A system-associated [Microlunatus speluncae]
MTMIINGPRTRLHHLIEHSATIRPTAAALTVGDRTLDYAELWRGVAAVGAGLAGLGLGRGDRVAVFAEKRIETVQAIFGTSVADGLFVPINPVLRAPQVGHIVRDCTARLLITTTERLASLLPVLSGMASLEHILIIGPPPQHALPDGGPRIQTLESVITAATRAEPNPTPAGVDLDPAAILYTSGSTGSPKGVVLSHRNLIAGAESVAGYLRNDHHDVILSVLPLSFDAGFSQLTTGFLAGAHVVLMNYLLPAEVARLCQRHGVTGLTCVPPLWLQLISVEWPAEARERLRYFANTGGRMPRSTLAQLRTLFPTALPYLMYGLTEAFRSTYLEPAQVDLRPDSIGQAIPNAEILVVRPDGSRCDPGEEGELVHRGSLVALGYWNDPVRTSERFRPVPGLTDGWRQSELAVWSGDRVVRDEDGYLYFVGRNDEMIKTSGYRVSPTEIEEAAYATGMVRDAVALGVADERLGQRIVLLATENGHPLTPTALIAAMRRELPLFQVPSEVIVREELPRSANGKYDRTLIRTELRS